MPIPNEIFNKIKANEPAYNEIHLSSQHPGLSASDIEKLVDSINQSNNAFIKRLILNDNTISDQGMTNLSKLKGIEVLCLSNNEITDNGLQSLNHIDSITELDLTGNPLTDEGLAQVLKLPKLKSLFVSGDAIGSNSVKLLLKHKTLEQFIIFEEDLLEVDSLTIDKIMAHVENNKKLAESTATSNKSQISEQTQYLIKIDEKENVDVNELIQNITQIMRKVGDSEKQEIVKQGLLNLIQELPILPNSPECKG